MLLPCLHSLRLPSVDSSTLEHWPIASLLPRSLRTRVLLTKALSFAKGLLVLIIGQRRLVLRTKGP